MERFVGRAGALFGLLLLLIVIGGVVTIAAGEVSAGLRMALVPGVVLGLAWCTALLLGLAARRPWAISAAIWVCVGLVVLGLVRALIDLAAGRVTIPLEAIFAAVVLAARPPVGDRPTLDGGERRIAAAVVGFFVVSSIWPYLAASGALSGIGGIGVADPDALDIAISLDCPTGAAAATPSIRVQVDWGWVRSELVTPGVDGLVVRWAATDIDGNEIDLFWSEVDMRPTPEVATGSSGPTAALTEPVAIEGPSLEFSVQMDPPLAGGLASLALAPSEAGADHGAITVWAAYAHGDHWLKETGQSSCRW